MKIKVGDLTVKQLHSICQNRFCVECPLYGGDSEEKVCKAYRPRYDDDIVEIPDNILAGMAERQTPET